MVSVLVGNGMGMIWHGEGATWSEPVASAIPQYSDSYHQLQQSLCSLSCGGSI